MKAIAGHVCFYCHHVFDQTKDNPSRTDFCVKCGHRGEGIKRALEKRDWGILNVVPNATNHYGGPTVDGVLIYNYEGVE